MKQIKITDWERLSARVIMLFATSMLMTYAPPMMHGFFGDIPYAQPNHFDMMDDAWKWGIRHYLYQFMCIALFVIQAIRIIAWVGKTTDKPGSFQV